MLKPFRVKNTLERPASIGKALHLNMSVRVTQCKGLTFVYIWPEDQQEIEPRKKKQASRMDYKTLSKNITYLYNNQRLSQTKTP